MSASQPARRRRRGRTVLVTVLLVLAAATVAAIVLRQTRTPAGARTLVEPLARGLFLREVTGTGVVLAERQQSLTFRSSGTVAEVPVAEGDAVAEGDVLARLDTATLEREIASTRASLSSARADLERVRAQEGVDTLDARSAVAAAEDQRLRAQTQLDRAQDDLRVARELLAVGAASADEVRTAETAVASAERALAQADIALDTAGARQASLAQLAEAQRAGAEAQVAQLQTQLANAEARSAEAVLRAPFAGVVTAVNVEAGDLVAQQPVVTVSDVSRVHVEARFDENRAAELTVGQAASIVPDADASRHLEARVTRLSPVAGREAGAAQVVVDLDFVDAGARDGADGAAAAPADVAWLRPGYTVTVRVRVRQIEDALLMPLEAITETPTETFVYRVAPTGSGRSERNQDGGGVAHRVPVTVLERNPTVAAVEGELRPGDLIAVVDLDSLTDGANVRYPAPSGPAPAPTP